MQPFVIALKVKQPELLIAVVMNGGQKDANGSQYREDNYY